MEAEDLAGQALPGEIGDFSQLTVLDLSSNQLTGTVPPGFAALPFLGSVDLASNQLTPVTGACA